MCDIADVRALEFTLIGSNVRVDRDSLRPCELSYPAMIAEMSKFYQATTPDGNTQFTPCDAIDFDFGMEMSRETFTAEGLRRIPEPTAAERENSRGELW